VVHLAAGTPDPDIDAVLDLVERTVRKDSFADVQREQA
jgi:hypothetical protein